MGSSIKIRRWTCHRRYSVIVVNSERSWYSLAYDHKGNELPMIRKIMALVVGIVAGGAFNMAIVTASHAAFPLPEGIDPNDFAALKAHVVAHGMPTGALIMVLVAHAGGSLVSGFVCGLIARRSWYVAGIGLGILWTCGGIAMLMMLPAPTWFAVADVVLYVPAALLGVRLGGALMARRPPSVPT
jgi:hypothetical protein